VERERGRGDDQRRGGPFALDDPTASFGRHRNVLDSDAEPTVLGLSGRFESDTALGLAEFRAVRYRGKRRRPFDVTHSDRDRIESFAGGEVDADPEVVAVRRRVVQDPPGRGVRRSGDRFTGSLPSGAGDGVPESGVRGGRRPVHRRADRLVRSGGRPTSEARAEGRTADEQQDPDQREGDSGAAVLGEGQPSSRPIHRDHVLTVSRTPRTATTAA
jgi:hypothetical protein